MSFRQGARQFFERRGAPTPPLPYDAEVEYLESTGTQYIDTGVAMDYAHVTFGGTFSTSAVGTGGFAAGFFLTALQSYTRAFDIEITTNARLRFCVIAGPSVYGDFLSGLVETNGSVDFAASPHVATIDGVDMTFSSVDWAVGNIYAFGTGSVFGSVRIHSLWVKNDGVLVRDFIPVRFTNEQNQSEGAMYDRVSGALFRNAGTGAFRFGTDK